MSSFVKDIEDAKLYSLMPNISESLLDYLFTNIVSKKDILADIGCGTGRLTRELLNNGNIVYGIEIDDNMISVCCDNLKEFDKFHMVKGCDTNTNLDNNSIDCILVSQALHRFDMSGFRKECSRILKNKNNIVVMWNRVQYGKDIFKELLITFKSVYPSYKSRFGELDEVCGSILEMDENIYSARCLIGPNIESKFFKNDYIMSHSEFRDLVLSLGLFPLLDNSNNSRILDEIDVKKFIRKIDKIFYKYAINDKITLPFVADLHYMKCEV